MCVTPSDFYIDPKKNGVFFAKQEKMKKKSFFWGECEKKLYICGIFFVSSKTVVNMALEIKSAPVLEGQAAVEFYERWATAKEGRSKEEVQELNRKYKAYFAKYCNPYLS